VKYRCIKFVATVSFKWPTVNLLPYRYDHVGTELQTKNRYIYSFNNSESCTMPTAEPLSSFVVVIACSLTSVSRACALAR